MSGYRGKQRKYKRNTDSYPSLTASADSSIVVQSFLQYRRELDAKHDKFERIVKLSRDITIESKRLIFSLQALCRSNTPENDAANILVGIQKLLSLQFRTISKELENEDAYQYLKAYSPGLQEYIEAVTLYHFIQHGVLYNWNQFKSDVTFKFDLLREGSKDSMSEGKSENNEMSEGKSENSEISEEVISTKMLSIVIPISEYVLGVQDLSGELMRQCISNFAAGKVDDGFDTCRFVKLLYIGMLHLGNLPVKEFWRKLFVFKQSLNKMETACYMMSVRGSEILGAIFSIPSEEPTREEDYETEFY